MTNDVLYRSRQAAIWHRLTPLILLLKHPAGIARRSDKRPEEKLTDHSGIGVVQALQVRGILPQC